MKVLYPDKTSTYGLKKDTSRPTTIKDKRERNRNWTVRSDGTERTYTNTTKFKLKVEKVVIFVTT